MKRSLALWISSITASSSFATRRASSKRFHSFLSCFVHLDVLARILSSIL
jgi:hypothetical protein